jgi:hypothetical protein
VTMTPSGALFWMADNLPLWRDLAIAALALFVLACLSGFVIGWELAGKS